MRGTPDGWLGGPTQSLPRGAPHRPPLRGASPLPGRWRTSEPRRSPVATARSRASMAKSSVGRSSRHEASSNKSRRSWAAACSTARAWSIHSSTSATTPDDPSPNGPKAPTSRTRRARLRYHGTLHKRPECSPLHERERHTPAQGRDPRVAFASMPPNPTSTRRDGPARSRLRPRPRVGHPRKRAPFRATGTGRRRANGQRPRATGQRARVNARPPTVQRRRLRRRTPSPPRDVGAPLKDGQPTKDRRRVGSRTRSFHAIAASNE